MRTLVPFLAVVIAGSLALPAAAQDDLETVRAKVDETQARLEDAQARADEATVAYAAAETRLGELDVELNRLEAELAVVEAREEELRSVIATFVVDQFTGAGGDELLVFELSDLNEHSRADAMTGFLAPITGDEIDEYRLVKAQADQARSTLEERRAEQVEVLAQLDASREAVYEELANVEAELANLNAILAELEEEERRRIEAELQRQRELEQARAAAAAATSTTTTTAPPTTTAEPAGDAGGNGDTGDEDGNGDTGDEDGNGGDSTTTTEPPTTTTVPPPLDGVYLCPVAGPVSFTDSWGAPRSGGRRHQGVDMLAATGTPVVAPVSGFVTHRGNSIGGLSFHLDADDGNFYYGTHLSEYAASGNVSAGTVIGYVGATGNASTPHLHFEVHLGGYGNAVNPYPYVVQWC